MSSDDDDDLDLLADMPDIGSDTDDYLLDGLDDEDFGFGDDDDLDDLLDEEDYVDEEEPAAPAPPPAPVAEPAGAPMAEAAAGGGDETKASVNDVLARMRAQRELSRAKVAETLERTAVSASAAARLPHGALPPRARAACRPLQLNRVCMPARGGCHGGRVLRSRDPDTDHFCSGCRAREEDAAGDTEQGRQTTACCCCTSAGASAAIATGCRGGRAAGAC